MAYSSSILGNLKQSALKIQISGSGEKGGDLIPSIGSNPDSFRTQNDNMDSIKPENKPSSLSERSETSSVSMQSLPRNEQNLESV